VRQSLFTAADVAGGGRQKALAAALGLKAILPSVTARAIGLAIPMPGHGAGTAPLPAGGAPPTRLVPVPSLAAAAGGPGAPEPAEEDCVPFTEWPDNAAAAAAALRTLVSTADVVFLLTDSRESRWLPTLLCQVEDKLCVNAAMGFDSFVVMRHGARALADDGASVDWASSPHLGCYFCADIVTPANSLRDRSLDQQCTVTRPGLSMATSALAAELAVALTQHKRGLRAPALACGAGAAAGAEAARDDDDDGSATNGLGAVPQQLRGSLFSMTQTAMRAEAHDACCACGARVVGEYRARGAEFVAKVLVDAQFLDEFSGLAAIRRAAEEAAAKWDLSDEEAGGEGDGSDDDFGFE
jgi:ubiquitin-like modifier-activating enzyme ATG7